MTVSISSPYQLENHASLLHDNTLQVNIKADQLARLYDASFLPELLEQLDHPPLVLGAGSNVLFRHNYHGSVLVMNTYGVQATRDKQGTRLAVAAGERWDDLVRWSLGQGYAGFENLILIPGTVGAAPVQNIGAYGVEIAQFIESVEAWDKQAQGVVTLTKEQCQFSYRHSLFKQQPDRYIITAVRFYLPDAHTPCIHYSGLEKELEKMRVPTPTPYHVAEAVQILRTRKLPDPSITANAGSFFKNPIVSRDKAEALLKAHPQMKQWALSKTTSKLSAAWMIEQCHLKGHREGDAGISNRHALVIVNHGTASGEQLYAFAQTVQQQVNKQFGVELQPEPRIIPAP